MPVRGFLRKKAKEFSKDRKERGEIKREARQFYKKELNIARREESIKRAKSLARQKAKLEYPKRGPTKSKRMQGGQSFAGSALGVSSPIKKRKKRADNIFGF